tara:strand:+ start:1341 stop:1706 length:366 start_codon:yes stop_codon:yes gene_type:complete
MACLRLKSGFVCGCFKFVPWTHLLANIAAKTPPTTFTGRMVRLRNERPLDIPSGDTSTGVQLSWPNKGLGGAMVHAFGTCPAKLANHRRIGHDVPTKNNATQKRPGPHFAMNKHGALTDEA